MPMRELVYKENLIVKHSATDYHAFCYDEGGEIIDKNFPSLRLAQQWVKKQTTNRKENSK